MHRKKLIASAVLTSTLLFVLLVLSSRGGLLRSSLLGDNTSSGQLMFNLSTETQLKEFEKDEERSLLYTTLIGGEEKEGFYIPRVYKTADNSTGLLALSYKGKDYISLEQRITLDIQLPATGLSYTGTTPLMFDGYVLTVQNDTDKNILHIGIASTGTLPKILDKSIDPFLYIPVHVNFLQAEEVRFKILSAKSISFAGVESVLPVVQVEGEIHRTSLQNNVASGSGLPEISKKILTQPLDSVKKVVFTSAESLKYIHTPEIMTAESSISPVQVSTGGETPIYTTVTVSDKDGINDIEGVKIDLTNVGLGKETRLLESTKNQEKKVFSTNFVLPTSLQGKEEPYRLPYVAFDKEGHKVYGEFLLLILPSKRTIKVDINQDGQVDIKDLTLFVNAYQEATK